MGALGGTLAWFSFWGKTLGKEELPGGRGTEFAPQTSQNCRDGTVTGWDQWTAIWRQSSESEALAEVGCGEKQGGQLATP